MNWTRGILVGVFLLTLAASTAWAQATAQINGTVADSSGAILPGVTVVAIQTDTGFRREAVTDEKGAYGLLNLPLGPYRIEASLAGFRSYAQTGVVLQVNSNPVINVTLQLGELNETLTVQGQAPLVETRNPAVGQVIENERIEALPLEGRNPTALITLGGAAADTGPPTSRSMTSSRGISIAGGQAFGVAYLLDGAMHNNAFDGFNMPLPFPDALQEFKVETSSQNAQNGTHAGGTVSLVTKSGTNQLHGDLFEFARNHRFNATSPFAGINPKTGKRLDDGLSRNQFGGVAGGPIVENKLFFFGAYQTSRSKQTPADLIAFVPTAAMLAGDFTAYASAACNARGAVTLSAAAGFANNRIDPSRLSPAAVALAKRLPQATDPCGRTTYSNPTKPIENQSIGKVDWQINQNHSLFGRIIYTTTFWDPPYVNNNNLLSTSLGGRDSDARSVAIGDAMVLSSSLVNNIRFAYHHTNVHRTNAPYFNGTDVGIKNLYTYVPDTLLVAVTNAFNLGLGTEFDSFYRPDTYSFSDDVTMVRGQHQFGFGGMVTLNDWKLRSNVRTSPGFTFDGSVTGLPLSDFLFGRLRQFRQSSPFIMDATQRNFGVYGQDTWRTSSRMTVNYGVRWEPWFPQQHQNGAIYNFSLARFQAGQRSTVFPESLPGFTYPGDPTFYKNSGLKPNWMNIQPRVGVSWDPNGDGKTSIRAGYGLNGDFISGQYFFDANQAWPFNYEVNLIAPDAGTFDDPWGSVGRTNPYPVTLGRGLPLVPNGAFIEIPDNLKGTRVHTWNLAYQRQLGNEFAMSATYMGNYMAHIWGDVTGNPALLPTSNPTGACTLNGLNGPQTFANCSTAPQIQRREIYQANPQIGQYIGYLDWITDAGWQRYNGLLLSVQKRAGNGLSYTGNYTLSKCEGIAQSNTGGNPLNVGTGYTYPQSLLNPPANSKELFEKDKGACSNSPTHIVNVTASAETPRFDGTVARVLASGWRLSGIFRAQSGNPIRVTAGIDRSLDGVTPATQRANQISDNVYLKTGNAWLNPAAFAQPALGTQGNSVYNAYRGPKQKTVDLSLVRQFPLGGMQRLEARVEAFNALNWFRPPDPITALSSPQFGQLIPTATALAGDPRIMQFALKYVF